ncbi:hypothetical protein V8C37DRAFT_374846 [Trichoderma ceciliae]
MTFIQQRLGGTLPFFTRRGLVINNRIARLFYQRQLASYLRTASQQRQRSVAPRISAPSLIYKIQQIRALSITRPCKMASDEDYMAFLNKANQDADEGKAAAQTTQSAGQRTFKTTDEGSQLPKSISDVCKNAFYVSEADEPFKGVSLKWKGEGGLPDEVDFAKLIRHWDAENAQIDIMDPLDWDSQGQYTNIIDAVREATRGNDVRVYRVARDLTRAEYWVISRDDEDDRIVGVKALGVES